MDQAPLYQSKRCVIALMAIAAAYPFAQARDFGAVGASTATGTSVASSTYYAAGRSDITNRALARRDEKIQSAMSALEKGREYYKDKKYEDALREYKQALDILPKAPITDDRRAFMVKSVGDASVAVAQEYRTVGRYDEARTLLMDAIKIDPKNRLAQRELTFLDDPIRANPGKTPQYVKDVEEVNRLLNMGYGYYDLGQYDAAFGEFNKVLRIDPYNVAARRGQETVERRREAYYSAAYDQRRASALREVTQAWEMSVPAEAPEVPGVTDGTSLGNQAGQAAIMQKLRTINIPRVDFEDTPVEDAIQFLRQRAAELDQTVGPNGQRGINFVFNSSQGVGMPSPTATMDLDVGIDDGGEELTAPPAAPVQSIKDRRIRELKLNNVPMIEVLRQICQNTGLRYKVEDHVVSILPADGNDTDLYTRSFPVPADFISALSTAAGDTDGGGASEDPFGSSTGSTGLRPRRTPTELFKRMGITFGEGCSATYIASNSTLLVRNTTANLDMIEQTIENIKGQNKQIKISTKFVEINQENTDELSFDWVVTPFSINDSRSLFAGGGTAEGTGLGSGDFVGNPGGVTGWPVSSTSDIAGGAVTGGIRSGSGAISKDSLDSLMLAQNRSEATQNYRAPGIMSMTGIYDEGAFQAIMRGLSQKKGSDVLTAPSILARPGEAAKIEVIREFIYPEEYEPPQLPTNVGNNNDSYRNQGSLIGGLTGGSSPQVNSFPVTPATPTSFTSRSVGVTLEVEATVGENNYVIDLNFKPEIVEFEGFVNYGSPIQSTGVGSDGKPVSITLTDNRIEQPIFSTRRVETKVFIYDGYTVGIGGLITESVQTVEDKVPIFGDLPFVGRFFRGNSESHSKKNLMIFVTGEIVDATGLPVRGRSLSTGLPSNEGEMGLPGTDAGLLPPAP